MESSENPDVLFIHRKAVGAQVSIERVFDQVRRGLGPAVAWAIHVSPCPSKGLVPRLRNLWAVWKAGRGKICHITGDVHYLALALPGRRLVLTIHDCAILHRLRGWRRQLIRQLWFVWPVRRAAVVTTISEATRDDLRQWLPPELWQKVRVIPNCVRSEFVSTPKEWNAVSPVFLQVGTGWNKNLARVGEALDGLACRLWIVGPVDGTQRALLQSHNLDFDCLGCLSDEDMADAYRRCDCLLFVSLFEGFGVPILEAQATGRPVITSNRGSMLEVACATACFVDPEDVASIRAAARRIMDDADLRQSLVLQGLANVRRFQAGAVAARYQAIYQELTAQLPGASVS
jgi:glycosyltransferase involved in cell wall biosynthesis